MYPRKEVRQMPKNARRRLAIGVTALVGGISLGLGATGASADPPTRATCSKASRVTTQTIPIPIGVDTVNRAIRIAENVDAHSPAIICTTL
jgi:hypothetical protein